MKLIHVFFLIKVLLFSLFTQAQSLKIAKLKYSGGGDWYCNKTSLPNLIEFCNEQIKTNINSIPEVVEIGSIDLFLYPFVHLTGHGNVVFSQEEAENLRKYLISGGFLHIDDNYGLDPFIRKEMKKVFPELDFVELPFSHSIYHQKYNFNDGLPKVHEHDGKPSQGFGLIYNAKLVCFYSYESDLGNGWEDQEVYNDPQEIRLKALQMGVNIIGYAFSENE